MSSRQRRYASTTGEFTDLRGALDKMRTHPLVPSLSPNIMPLFGSDPVAAIGLATGLLDDIEAVLFRAAPDTVIRWTQDGFGALGPGAVGGIGPG